jgi:ATP-binding cassette, subfamily B (MDR/TAP), member 1
LFALNSNLAFLFVSGGMLSSFLCLYLVLALFGSFLIYRDVRDSGCDPSDAVKDNPDLCDSNGPGVFGAMLGVAFAAQGVSQVGNFFEAFAAARVATYDAIQAMNRKAGAPAQTIYKTPEEIEAEMSTTQRKSSHGKRSEHVRGSKHGAPENDEKVVKAVLPMYEIDTSSDAGVKPAPSSIRGSIKFDNVHFTYPTRPTEPVLKGMSFSIQPGETVAFVGPSGTWGCRFEVGGIWWMYLTCLCLSLSPHRKWQVDGGVYARTVLRSCFWDNRAR